MKKAAMAIVFGVAFGMGGAWRAGGEEMDARTLRGRLAEKGVEGMYAECRENDWEMPAIRSAWAVSLMAGSGGSAQDTGEERERRALGFELAVALDVLSGEIIRETDPTALEARAGWLVELADWLGRANGYGNWLLSERAERLACVPLGRLAACRDYPTGKALALRARMKTARERLETRRAVLDGEANAGGVGEWKCPADECRLRGEWMKNAKETEQWCRENGVFLPFADGEWRLLPGKRSFFTDDGDVGDPVTTSHRWNRKLFRKTVVDARRDSVQAGLDALLTFRRATGNIPAGEDTTDLLRTKGDLPSRIEAVAEGNVPFEDEREWVERVASWAKWRMDNGEWADEDSRNWLQWQQSHPGETLEMVDEAAGDANARKSAGETRGARLEETCAAPRLTEVARWRKVLQTSGLDGLLADVRNTGARPPEMPSSYFAERMAEDGAEEDELERVSEARAFGRDLARVLEARAMELSGALETNGRLAMTEQLTELSAWIGEEHGYGNWLLVKRSEAVAWMSLGYLAADEACNLDVAEAVKRRLLGEEEALRFRADVLEKESPGPFTVLWSDNVFENQRLLEDAWRSGERRLHEWGRKHGFGRGAGSLDGRRGIPPELAFFADDATGRGRGTIVDIWDLKVHSECAGGLEQGIRREVEALFRFRREFGQWPAPGDGESVEDAFEQVWALLGHGGDRTGRIAGRAFAKAREYRLMDLETAVLRQGVPWHE